MISVCHSRVLTRAINNFYPCVAFTEERHSIWTSASSKLTIAIWFAWKKKKKAGKSLRKFANQRLAVCCHSGSYLHEQPLSNTVYWIFQDLTTLSYHAVTGLHVMLFWNSAVKFQVLIWHCLCREKLRKPLFWQFRRGLMQYMPPFAGFSV